MPRAPGARPHEVGPPMGRRQPRSHTHCSRGLMMSRNDTRETAARHPWWASVRPLARIVLAPLASLLLLGSTAWSQTHTVTTVTTGTSGPIAVAADAGGVRYVAENDGTTTLLANVIHRLYGIAVAPSGTAYVSDLEAHRILEIDPEGNILTLAGSTRGYADGTGGDAKFAHPAGLALDASGNLYVADRDNHRIRRIDTATGEVTTVAGSSLGYLDAQRDALRRRRRQRPHPQDRARWHRHHARRLDAGICRRYRRGCAVRHAVGHRCRRGRLDLCRGQRQQQRRLLLHRRRQPACSRGVSRGRRHHPGRHRDGRVPRRAGRQRSVSVAARPDRQRERRRLGH